MSDDLQDEWARANRAGSLANRQKVIATLAAVGVTAILVGVGYALLFVLWPFDRIPVLFLSLPWVPALGAGWWIRRRLWARGAFGQ